MSSTNSDSANLPRATPEQVDSLVRTALGAGDSGATRAIQNLTLVQQARISQLQRTVAAATKQHGADSAETKTAAAAVTIATARVASMTAVHLQAATPAPEVSATGWALHGRVFDAPTNSSSIQLQPAPNLTVFLVDAQKKYQAQFGFAYTDANGYFLLNYVGPKGKTQTSGQYFVEIADKNARPFYLSTTAFQPVTGSATYLNITLPADKTPLGDPPAELRTDAFPNTPKA